jgi:hypothetical protein
MDRELREYLNSYTVPDADEALLSRIMGQVEDSKVVSFPARQWQAPILARVAALAIVAVLGFSGGMVSRQVSGEIAVAQSDTQSSHEATIYNVILNPQNLEEIML